MIVYFKFLISLYEHGPRQQMFTLGEKRISESLSIEWELLIVKN